ncbi:hypothetical protein A4A49_53270 [Nicotiana attenuata]|uniref:Uncharacterized protein n=1 Tax=Nicotiana attenuata TaxID=49451 RepID=A0A314KN46_NICAT|nr:hypothetical protein A4A49_53270 [Nicotiana attenuata]
MKFSLMIHCHTSPLPMKVKPEPPVMTAACFSTIFLNQNIRMNLYKCTAEASSIFKVGSDSHRVQKVGIERPLQYRNY